MTPSGLETRFWLQVDRRGVDECWPWCGGKNSGGYGRIKLDYHYLMAHRVAYELLVGPIPEGLTIDHLCRNRACVNPAHLEPVTLRENILRGDTLAAHCAAKTHCKHGHPFSAGNTRIERSGKRSCRTCHKRLMHNWRVKTLRGCAALLAGPSAEELSRET